MIGGQPQGESISLIPENEGQFCVYSAKEPWTLFIHLLMVYMVQAPPVTVNMLKYDDGSPF